MPNFIVQRVSAEYHGLLLVLVAFGRGDELRIPSSSAKSTHVYVIRTPSSVFEVRRLRTSFNKGLAFLYFVAIYNSLLLRLRVAAVTSQYSASATGLCSWKTRLNNLYHSCTKWLPVDYDNDDDDQVRQQQRQKLNM